jgi:hypothetical protein
MSEKPEACEYCIHFPNGEKELATLRAENQRLREALEQINSIKVFSAINCINYRDIARAALGKE